MPPKPKTKHPRGKVIKYLRPLKPKHPVPKQRLERLRRWWVASLNNRGWSSLGDGGLYVLHYQHVSKSTPRFRRGAFGDLLNINKLQSTIAGSNAFTGKRHRRKQRVHHLPQGVGTKRQSMPSLVTLTTSKPE